jgi:multiple sugar transport system substrate-binding protein
MKKIIGLLLVIAIVSGLMLGCSNGDTSNGANVPSDVISEKSADNDEKKPEGTASEPGTLTLYSTTTTNPNFEQYIADVEQKLGLKFNIIAAPTNSDTRQQKITTVLSSGDKSIDLFEINDEMAAAFKNTGWLQPLQNDVMTPEVVKFFPQDYIKDMVTSANGDIVTVPYYRGCLAFWVDQKKLDEIGMQAPTNKEEFIAVAKAATKDGNYGYGGAWEKTYVFNEIGTFVNLFGGDYFDWTNPKNKEAIEFMYDMANTWQVTPKSQLSEKYEQMNQRLIDGKCAMVFMWGSGQDYKDAGRYGDDQIHMAQMPKFETRSAFADSWGYALNSVSENKEDAYKFLRYTASKEGSLEGWDYFERYPARSDAEADPNFENEIKEMYQLYSETTTLRGRPMLPQTMEFITDIGTIFQQYIQDGITADEFCIKAQEYVEAYK